MINYVFLHIVMVRNLSMDDRNCHNGLSTRPRSHTLPLNQCGTLLQRHDGTKFTPISMEQMTLLFPKQNNL